MPKMPPPYEEEGEALSTAPSNWKRVEGIRASVLRALGRPQGLLRVNVLPLWGDHFRVNVLIGEDATAVHVPNSFFVTADERGAIVRSDPAIQKLY